MYNFNYSESNNIILQSGRTFRSKLVNKNNANQIVGPESFIEFTSIIGSCGGDSYTFGSIFTGSYSASIRLNNVIESYDFFNNEWNAQIGLLSKDDNGNDVIDYISIGIFKADINETIKEDGILYLKMNDRAMYVGNENYTPTITFTKGITTFSDYLIDIKQTKNIEIKFANFSKDNTQVSESIPNIFDNVIDEEITKTQISDFFRIISGVAGACTYVDNDGCFIIMRQPYSTSSISHRTINSDVIIGFTCLDEDFVPGKVTIKKNDTSYDIDGEEIGEVTYSYGDSSPSVAIVNKYITEETFNDLSLALTDVDKKYRPANIDFLGDPRLTPMDIVNVSINGESYFMPCMNIIHDFDGGLKTSITSVGIPSDEHSFSGPLTSKIKEIVSDIISTKELFADNAKITNAKIKKLETEEISADRLDVDGIFAKDINATGTIEGVTLKGSSGEFTKYIDVSIRLYKSKSGLLNYITEEEYNNLSSKAQSNYSYDSTISFNLSSPQSDWGDPTEGLKIGLAHPESYPDRGDVFTGINVGVNSRNIYLYGEHLYFNAPKIYIVGEATVYSDLNVYGGLISNNHESPIGTVIENPVSTAVVMPSGVWTVVNEISLQAGTWIVTGTVRFNANSEGYRGINISYTPSQNAFMEKQTAVQGTFTALQVVKIISIDDDTSIYLNAYQNSGADISTSTNSDASIIGMVACRIA